MGILDEIRERCAEVAAVASSVRIDADRLRAYAGELAPLPPPSDDPGREPLAGDVDATVAYVVALDAVNFGSGWFPVLRKRPGMSGYHTVAACFRDHVAAHGPPTAEWSAASTSCVADPPYPSSRSRPSWFHASAKSAMSPIASEPAGWWNSSAHASGLTAASHSAVGGPWAATWSRKQAATVW